MRLSLPLFVGLLTLTTSSLLGLATSGCGGSSETAPAAAPTDDAGPITPPKKKVDAGSTDEEDSSTPFGNVYPAPHPDSRQLVKLAGPILEHPHVVPIFYGNDMNREKAEAILAQLPGSTYWAALKEYGVQDITIEKSVIVGPTAPTTYSLEDIEATVASTFTLATNPAPAPDGTQIYAIFFPPGTTVNQVDGSPFCSAGGAYHEEAPQNGATKQFSYAVMPYCGTSFDDLMVSTTHELMEAATDPLPLTNPAWAGTDKNHVGFRGEIGDLCDYSGKFDSFGAPLFGTRVERMFSNERSKQGIDPCSPDIGIPFFGAAPVPKDDIVVNDALLGQLPGRGVSVPIGKSKTIDLALFAQKDIGVWTVNVKAYDPMIMAPTDNLTLSVDTLGGKNGDTLHLTVTRKSNNSSGFSQGDVIFVTSYSSSVYWIDTIYVGE